MLVQQLVFYFFIVLNNIPNLIQGKTAAKRPLVGKFNQNNSTHECKKSKAWLMYAVKNKELFDSTDQNIPVFVLEKWFERMGNNYMQIKHALRYAICCNAKLEIREKNAFMPALQRYLDFSRSIPYDMKGSYSPPKNCAIGWSDTFFQPFKSFPMPECVYDEYSAIQSVVFGNDFSYDCLVQNVRCAADLEKSLVVHIRSGDIFSRKNPPRTAMNMYRQPPLAFYKEIFQLKKWDRILLVTSVEPKDSYNPVWSFLVDKDNIRRIVNTSATVVTYQTSSSTKEDLKTLWCARYFVASSSTFSNMIIQTGPYLREFFGAEKSLFGQCSTFQNRINQHGIKCNQLSLPGYEMASSFNWTNSPEQRDLMISYKIPKKTVNSGSYLSYLNF